MGKLGSRGLMVVISMQNEKHGQALYRERYHCEITAHGACVESVDGP